MEKLIAAVLLVNLSAAVNASEIERLRASGFGPITLEQIKARPAAGNKGVSIVVNNTNINNGSSSVSTNVDVNNSAVNSPGNNSVNIAVNNTNVHNGANSAVTNVDVQNTGLNSPGHDNINIDVNNNSAGSGINSADTDINVQNADGNSAGDDNINVAVNNNTSGAAVSNVNTGVDIGNTDNGAYSDGEIGVNIGNTSNGNAIAVANTDVTVNGVNANAGKEAVYQSPVLYRYESLAQRALDRALYNLARMKNVQVLSKKITERIGRGYTFEVRFRSNLPLRTYASGKLYTYASQAESSMYGKVMDLQDRKGQVVSAELMEAGYSYTYLIAYFQAK